MSVLAPDAAAFTHRLRVAAPEGFEPETIAAIDQYALAQILRRWPGAFARVAAGDYLLRADAAGEKAAHSLALALSITLFGQAATAGCVLAPIEEAVAAEAVKLEPAAAERFAAAIEGFKPAHHAQKDAEAAERGALAALVAAAERLERASVEAAKVAAPAKAKTPTAKEILQTVEGRLAELTRGQADILLALRDGAAGSVASAEEPSGADDAQSDAAQEEADAPADLDASADLDPISVGGRIGALEALLEAMSRDVSDISDGVGGLAPEAVEDAALILDRVNAVAEECRDALEHMLDLVAAWRLSVDMLAVDADAAEDGALDGALDGDADDNPPSEGEDLETDAFETDAFETDERDTDDLEADDDFSACAEELDLSA